MRARNRRRRTRRRERLPRIPAFSRAGGRRTCWSGSYSRNLAMLLNRSGRRGRFLTCQSLPEQTTIALSVQSKSQTCQEVVSRDASAPSGVGCARAVIADASRDASSCRGAGAFPPDITTDVRNLWRKKTRDRLRLDVPRVARDSTSPFASPPLVGCVTIGTLVLVVHGWMTLTRFG